MRASHSRLPPVSSLRLAQSIAALLAALVPMAKAGAVEPPDAAYIESYNRWKAALIRDLKENWLVLAGLFWLTPGATSFGSAADNRIVLPSGPAHAGTFHLEDDQVWVELEPAIDAKIAGRSQKSTKLTPDTSGQPTVIEMGSLRLYVIERGKRMGIRVKDLNSLAARNYSGPVFFPLDMAYRVTGTFAPANSPRTVEVPNVLGDATPTPVAGEVHFKLNGQDLTLTALGGNPAKGLSFVMSDPTSKTDTYPGGRFLDTDPVVDGKVVLDFNRAYNPPCAVTPYATCPLAPRENRLAARIAAGEMYDRKHAHH